MADPRHPPSQRTLTELLQGIPFRRAAGPAEATVTAVTADSRQVGPGSMFVAVEGQQADGHRFVEDACARGAAAVLVQKDLGIRVGRKVTVLQVPDTRQALGRVAAAYYGHPAKELVLIGITGTNGKTTTTYLLESMIQAAGGRPGVIGTVNYRFEGRELPAPFTTPEALTLQKLLRQMADAGVSHLLMEVSSHALQLHRLEAVFFDVALFTNLSRDHLDFHVDMAGYFDCKKKLFLEHLKEKGKAVVVQGAGAAEWGRRLARELPLAAAWQAAGRDGRQIITCGLGGQETVQGRRYRFGLQGMQAEVAVPGGELALHLPLVGRYNLENVLGAVGVGVALGLPAETMRRGMEQLAGVPGRLERVSIPGGPAVFVDYAHTPDALENVLLTLRQLQPARLVVVFGCGGDRDRGKRPLMGEVAGRLADVALVTSDNPRSEPPRRILAEIEAGLLELAAREGRLGMQCPPLRRCRAEILLREGRRGYDLIESRREAIRLALRYGRPGEVVLISGKGHENYQLGRLGRIFFDDRLEARNMSFRLDR